MTALQEKRFRIPDDIAFVGFNNDLIGRVTAPNLTTVNYPGYEMGKIAMQYLLDELNSNEVSYVPKTVVLQTEFVVRNSSIEEKRSSTHMKFMPNEMSHQIWNYINL